ncbi:MAG: small basic protein [Planctomycetia bacterium]
MTMHKSLKTRSTQAGTRSVLSRWERLEKLSAAGRWHEGDKVTGLPKVRTKFKVRRKAAPAAAGAAAAATPAAGAAAAAPAAGAKAAAAPAKAAAAPAAAAKPAKK